MADQVEIIAGEHEPAHPFMIVNRDGVQVDFSKVLGQLWDPTVAKIAWGMVDQQGRIFGRVFLKNGQGRNFWDPDLIVPYMNAYKARKAELAKGAEA